MLSEEMDFSVAGGDGFCFSLFFLLQNLLDLRASPSCVYCPVVPVADAVSESGE